MTTLRSFGRLLGMSALAGVFAAAIMTGVGRLQAAFGTPPQGNAGFALVDNQWLVGLASGLNFTYQSGVTAKASGTQATCTVLTSGVYQISVDTVGSSGDSVCLPFANAGVNVQIANNSSTTLNIFGQAGNNPSVSPAAADTINNTAGSSAYQLTTQQNADCFVAKNGAWRCVKGS